MNNTDKEVSVLIAKINSNTLTSVDLLDFEKYVKNILKMRKNEFPDISEDDLERLMMLKILMFKKENLGKNWISINPDDWKGKIDFSKIKFFIDDLELNRIIDHKILGLGGYISFELVEKHKFMKFIFRELLDIVDRLKKTELFKAIEIDKETEKKIRESVKETKENIIQVTLEHVNRFKKFVERDGWIAFWERSSVRNGLKSSPEEIARSQLLAYWKGYGFEKREWEGREISEGSGRADVVRIDGNGNVFIFELSIHPSQTEFNDHVERLVGYMESENINVGYYLIFDERSNPNNIDDSVERNDKTIYVRQIKINP